MNIKFYNFYKLIQVGPTRFVLSAMCVCGPSSGGLRLFSIHFNRI